MTLSTRRSGEVIALRCKHCAQPVEHDDDLRRYVHTDTDAVGCDLDTITSEVVPERLLERTHRAAPGQGCATCRSDARSTFSGDESSGGQILMTQYLADCDQAGAVAQQLASQGVPQPVRPNPRQAGSLACPLNDITHQVGADRSAGSSAGQEQMAVAVRVTSAGQVGDQGFTDLRRQGEPVLSASLAAHDDLPDPPVHVTQLQARDLDGAQAEPRNQHHDREVADTDNVPLSQPSNRR